MQIDITFFDALRQANVPEIAARAAAESLAKEIDLRYEMHSKQIATQTDIANLRTDMANLRGDIKTDIANLSKQIADTQRWTITVVFASIVALGAIQKLWG
jgi:hypothetical protein